MGRTRTGKTHNGQVRVTQKNGDVYVYERVTAYNPDTIHPGLFKMIHF